MKCKVKRLICLVCVFVASFMLTVTTFASDYGYDYFHGIYTKENREKDGKGYVSITREGCFGIFAYKDFDEKCYVTGRNGEGSISNGVNGLNATFSIVTKCTKDGKTPVNKGTIPDYSALGDVVGKTSKITIYSKKSNDVFILNK